MRELTYAAVTPVRDEERNLPRLAESLAAQTRRPVEWVLVDTGSTDRTLELAHELATAHPWIAVHALDPVVRAATRGAPIVRAFEYGKATLSDIPDVVVKLDADTSMPPAYFEGLMAAFAEDPSLGIASGDAAEEDEPGTWAIRHIAHGCAWGACRAYRWDCLLDVSPLEQAFGWDGIDQLKAELAGWKTGVVEGLEFRHHRREGERDGRRSAGWKAQGRGSYYMGYRFSFLLMRALFHARSDWTALAMIVGYLGARARRADECPNPEVKRLLREQQALRNVVRRRLMSPG